MMMQDLLDIRNSTASIAPTPFFDNFMWCECMLKQKSTKILKIRDFLALKCAFFKIKFKKIFF